MWRSGRRPGASSLLLLLHRAAVAVSAAVCCRCCCCVLPGCLGVHCEGLAAAAGAFGIGVDKHKLRPAPACWGRKIARASTGHHQTQPMSSTQGGNKPASRGLGRHSLQCQPSPAQPQQHSQQPAHPPPPAPATHLRRSSTKSMRVPRTCMRAAGSIRTLTPPSISTTSSNRPCRGSGRQGSSSSSEQQQRVTTEAG